MNDIDIHTFNAHIINVITCLFDVALNNAKCTDIHIIVVTTIANLTNTKRSGLLISLWRL